MPTPRKPNTTPYEEKEQQNLLTWAVLHEGKYPELKLLYHIPNGGKRSKSEAARFKAGGVKKGIPDLHLPVARGGYHSLYIEMKRVEGGRLSKEQEACIAALRREGNRVEICRGAEQGEWVLKSYLAGE